MLQRLDGIEEAKVKDVLVRVIGRMAGQLDIHTNTSHCIKKTLIDRLDVRSSIVLLDLGLMIWTGSWPLVKDRWQQLISDELGVLHICD
jgi:hypothetical protein